MPFNHLLPAWDAITGALATASLLAAERARARTGAGQYVRIALSDVAFWMVGNLGKIAEVQINHHERVKDGNYLYGAFGRDFLTKDGHRVMIVALTLRQWRNLVEATGLGDDVRRDRAHDGRRPRRRGRPLRGARGARRHAEAVGARAHACTRCARRSTATACPGARTRPSPSWSSATRAARPTNPMFAEVEQPGIGTYLMPGSPLAFSDAERLPAAPAPRLGEHTDEVLAERARPRATARSAACTTTASWPAPRRRPLATSRGTSDRGLRGRSVRSDRQDSGPRTARVAANWRTRSPERPPVGVRLGLHRHEGRMAQSWAPGITSSA